MRSVLQAVTPPRHLDWADEWELSGKDERIVRDLLFELDAYAAEPPVEVKRRGWGYETPDYGDAALLLWPVDSLRALWTMREPQRQAERAWTAEGAVVFADALPERLEEMAEALRRRFG